MKKTPSPEPGAALSSDASLYIVRGGDADFYPFGVEGSTPVRLPAGSLLRVTKPGKEWSGVETAQSGKGIIRTDQIRRAYEGEVGGGARRVGTVTAPVVPVVPVVPASKVASRGAASTAPASGVSRVSGSVSRTREEMTAPAGLAAERKPAVVPASLTAERKPRAGFWPGAGVPKREGGTIRALQRQAAEEARVTELPAAPPPEITIEGASSSELPSWNDGFFPTLQDTLFFGNINGGDYPRRYTGRPQGPDHPAQSHTGLYPYDSTLPSYGLRTPGSLATPLDRMMGVFVPFDAWVDEGNAYRDGALGQGFSGVVDADFPFFTQSFIPDRAHLKAGPVYLDLLSLGAGVLYSDFESETIKFLEGEEDGWLSFIELQLRAVARLTRSIYLSTAWSLYYLPGENDFGIRFPFGEQFMPYIHLNYHGRWGQWDVRLYDEFWVNSGLDLFWELDEEAYERAGRYYFGFSETGYRSNEFFDSDRLYLHNTLGALGSRPLGEDWRLWLGADHTDYWTGFDFDEHDNREHVNAALRYEGLRLPFAPYAIYDFYTYDDLDSYWNRFAVGGHGRITENLTSFGQVGYAWCETDSTDYDSLIWELSLSHHLSEVTWHRITVGQDFYTVDYSPDSARATRLGYQLYHYINSRLRSRFLAQVAEEEYVGRTFVGHRNLYGLDLDWRLFDYTHLNVGAYYEARDSSATAIDDELDHWLYYAALTQRIASRMTAWLRYQLEDDDQFDEHVVSMGVNRYF